MQSWARLRAGWHVAVTASRVTGHSPARGWRPGWEAGLQVGNLTAIPAELVSEASILCSQLRAGRCLHLRFCAQYWEAPNSVNHSHSTWKKTLHDCSFVNWVFLQSSHPKQGETSSKPTHQDHLCQSGRRKGNPWIRCGVCFGSSQCPSLFTRCKQTCIDHTSARQHWRDACRRPRNAPLLRPGQRAPFTDWPRRACRWDQHLSARSLPAAQLRR